MNSDQTVAMIMCVIVIGVMIATIAFTFFSMRETILKILHEIEEDECNDDSTIDTPFQVKKDDAE